MKLELKHALDHAKYGGRLRCIDDDGYWFNDKIKSIDIISGLIETKEGLGIELSDFGDFVFMVKRPLSDLTKEQLREIGYIIIPKPERNFKYDVFSFEDGQSWISGGMKPVMSLSECVNVMQYLYSIHADVSGLINKGLAIDINTINREQSH